MNTFKITLMPSGKTVEVPEGILLQEVLFAGGFRIEIPCGGRGTCGRCRVRAEGALTPLSVLEEEHLKGDPRFRLACQARVQGEATLYLPEEALTPGVQSGTELPDSIDRMSFAVDVGTTSLQVSVVDLNSGRSYPADSFLNPQRVFGHDVISRIAASRDPEKKDAMVRGIRDHIRLSLEGVRARIGGRAAVSSLVFSGNTVMTYLLSGWDVESLGRFPYKAERLDFEDLKTADFGIDDPDATCRAIPAASAYLGGDLIGGLAYTDSLGLDRDVFFIDLGTNGEIFLRNSGKGICAASCAMGPALEGMSMSCGVTACGGAIDHAWIEEGALRFSTIGGFPAVGIAGTGLVDIVAALLRSGSVRAGGNIDREVFQGPGALRGVSLAKNGIRITEELYISQKDIRNLQLAKGASLAASRILLKESGVSPDEVKKVLIAGALGENMNEGSFRDLGFVPEFRNAQYEFLGNTSLKAAEKACLDGNFYQRMKELRDRVRVIELSVRPDFNGIFMESLDLCRA